MRTVVLSAALAAVAAVGSAKAEPVALLGDQLDQVTAGTTVSPPFTLDVKKHVDINKMKHLDINAMLKSLLDIKGNLAEAEAAATAIGKASFSETLTLSEAVQDMYSRSFSESVAGANNPSGHRPAKPCRC